MTSNLDRFRPKIDATFKSEFEGPIFKIIGDFWRFGREVGKFSNVKLGSAEGGRPAKGRGKHKAFPWVQI